MYSTEQVVVVDRNVEVLFGQAAAGGTACLHGLELLAVFDAASDFFPHPRMRVPIKGG